MTIRSRVNALFCDCHFVCVLLPVGDIGSQPFLTREAEDAHKYTIRIDLQKKCV